MLSDKFHYSSLMLLPQASILEKHPGSEVEEANEEEEEEQEEKEEEGEQGKIEKRKIPNEKFLMRTKKETTHDFH